MIPVAAAFAAKPVVDQNMNNGKHPKPAPTWVPKPDWDLKNGDWKPEGGIQMAFGTLSLLNILTDGQQSFIPAQQTNHHSAPGVDPGGSNDDDNDHRECRADGNGWIEYGDLDHQNSGRSTRIGPASMNLFHPVSMG
ncbi:hypothetical protein ACIQRS_19975 [Streptomyces termitum]|uniref:hypothetical protein n=1 Tax=Streptomyces termitum TaxID=67368 RepID=UPI001677AB51|nr:hypothetical protein [Streptomyces termitum]